MPGQLFSAYLKIFTECTSTYITRTDLKKNGASRTEACSPGHVSRFTAEFGLAGG